MNILLKLVLVIKTIKNFHLAIFDRLGLVHGLLVYKTRNNLFFIARAGTEDIAEIAVVASGSEYPIEKIKLLKKPTIVDLGGHIGTFSVMLGKLVADNSRIFAFEPDKNNYKLLIKNISLNGLDPIIVPHNIAITDYNGKGYLKNVKINNDAYHLDTTASKKPNVRVQTLYDASKVNGIKKIDLLKMDIEGGEYKIFGDKKTFDYICKNVRYIFIEYHNLDRTLNSAFIRKIIKNKFKIIHHHKSVYTLQNITIR